MKGTVGQAELTVLRVFPGAGVPEQVVNGTNEILPMKALGEKVGAAGATPPP